MLLRVLNYAKCCWVGYRWPITIGFLQLPPGAHRADTIKLVKKFTIAVDNRLVGRQFKEHCFFPPPLAQNGKVNNITSCHDYITCQIMHRYLRQLEEKWLQGIPSLLYVVIMTENGQLSAPLRKKNIKVALSEEYTRA